MKKLLTLFTLIFCIAGFSHAQTNTVDVVYLKNGSIIKGTITEQIPNKSLKIKTRSGNIFVYKMGEIKKITRETAKNSSTIGNSGYWGDVNIGYAVGIGDYGLDRIKLNVVNGYRTGPHFAIGFGTGLHYYTEPDAALIPIYADFRANFLKNDISPYIDIKVGYSLDATSDFEGTGFLLNPSIGTRFAVSSNTALHFSIGYEMQKVPFIYSSYGYYATSTENSGALSFNFGVSF